MTGDGLFAAHMDYVAPLGLPRSKFLRWDRDDRDAVLAWQTLRATTHGPCGTRPEEWDPELGGSEFAYVAEIRGCRGCETLASAQRQLSKEQIEIGGHVVLVRNREVP